MTDKPLWSHQKAIIELARRKPDLALFCDMGVGKSRATIEILREKFTINQGVMRTLILGPLITVKNWQKEIKEFSRIKDADVIPLLGTGRKRLNTFLDNATDNKTETLTKPRIFITNYESMEMDELHEALCDWQPEILICDESHRLKSISSKRAKRVIKLLGEKAVIGTKEYTRGVKHCYILTGTPILNSAMDIFNQFRILDSGKTFGTNFYEFRGKFFDDENRGMPSQKYFPKWIERPECYEFLHNQIYRKAYRVLKSECLDLPPLLKKRIPIELGADQKRAYDEMKKEYITWVLEHEKSNEPKTVVAQMALTKALRLQQIATGFAKTEDGVEIVWKENPRLKVLSDLLEQITPSHKVIVWATFKRNYKQIGELCAKLGIKFVELHGDISAKDKEANIELFRGDPNTRVVIANQGAAGIGINLVEYADRVGQGTSSYSIFYSKNFSLEHDSQAESRNYRGGSNVYESVTRIDLVATGTIDELILEALEKKQSIADQILEWNDAL